MLVIAATLGAPAHLARAEDAVTYEVVSDSIPAVNIEYSDRSGRIALQEVPLPWRITATVPNAEAPTRDGAEIRIDWRRYRWHDKYVTVRIYSHGALRCESTLDIGNATCYGSTPHTSYPETAGG